MISLDPSDIELMKLTMQSAGTWFTKEDGTTPNMENNAALKANACKSSRPSPMTIWSERTAAGRAFGRRE